MDVWNLFQKQLAKPAPWIGTVVTADPLTVETARGDRIAGIRGSASLGDTVEVRDGVILGTVPNLPDLGTLTVDVL